MLADKKLFLFDIDGTIAVGDTLYDGTKELLSYIRSIGGCAYYITNNSTKSREDYVEKFQKCFGLEVPADRFVTSGHMTMRYLLTHYAGRKIFVLGTASFVLGLRRAGLQITEKPEPDIACAVAAYDSELNYGKLVNLCQVLSGSDIPFYATNPDLCCPVDFGFIPDCGSICEMITHSVKKEPLYLGKPSKEVVMLCMQESGFSKEETIVIGDRLYTDIACGINAGVETCAVLTGEAALEEMKTTAFPADYVYENVRALYEALTCRQA